MAAIGFGTRSRCWRVRTAAQRFRSDPDSSCAAFGREPRAPKFARLGEDDPIHSEDSVFGEDLAHFCVHLFNSVTSIVDLSRQQ